MKLGAEQIEQIKVMDWVRHNNLQEIILHIANERSCTPQHGAILKRMGVMKGVSDLFITRARRGYHGAWIELKASKGKLSPEQSKFLENMNREGYFAVCRFGADEAIKTIEDYLMMSST